MLTSCRRDSRRRHRRPSTQQRQRQGAAIAVEADGKQGRRPRQQGDGTAATLAGCREAALGTVKIALK
ncbi:hypothetical protein E2562_007463, partial [Oryza meyeriana var. granulata]